MATIEHNGKIYEVDDDGHLANPGDWDDGWVAYVFMDLDIVMDGAIDEYHKVNKALRSFYDKHGAPPAMRLFSKITGFPLKRLFELYSPSLGSLAFKMAGLRKPISN